MEINVEYPLLIEDRDSLSTINVGYIIHPPFVHRMVQQLFQKKMK